MLFPEPCGELSGWLSRHLLMRDRRPSPSAGDRRRPDQDRDFQLALWCCYELHYRGFDDVDDIDDEAEWDLEVLGFRARLEQRWSMWLQQFSPRLVDASAPPSRQLRRLIDDDDGPDLARYLQHHASLPEFRQLVMNRSVYQLKEADPHSFGIPRLYGAEKAALVEIQSDEYGAGRPERMHSELFKATMRWLGLSTEYGAYVADVPAVTLAQSNLMSYFALHRSNLPQLLGHLAALEMTSTQPNRRLAAAARRLGADDEAARYFDEHVEADAVHEQIAAHDLCDTYARGTPDTAAGIVFGARCCLALDALQATELLSRWSADLPVAR